MKRLVLISLFGFTLLFASCIDIIENIVLHKDGTGNYTLTMDMSNLMKDEFLAGMMKKTEDAEQKRMQEVDSTIYGKNLPAEEKGNNPEIWNRMSVRTIASEKSKKLEVHFMLDFENLSEISYMMKNIDKLGSKVKSPDSNVADNAPPTDMLLPSAVSYILDKNELVRSTAVVPKSAEAEADEEAGMMKMFLGEATYTVNYQLPGKVRKTTIPGALINGNTITTKVKLLDLMENERKLDGTIRF